MTVDYILFMTGDVTVAPNPNEIRDYKYVSKAELQAMFEQPGKYRSLLPSESRADSRIENSFTPWFKLIARDFLFGWWDELDQHRNKEGKVVAKNLAHLVQDKVIKMT
jgi:isopentenyl-diphosphate delta-isomerase